MPSVDRKWDAFLAFASLPNRELEQELRDAGADLDRLDLKVSQAARLWRSRQNRDWIARGRKAQEAFERTVRSKRDWISQGYADARELWAAVTSGGLGLGVQRHASVFFRNREDGALNEPDLRSFLDDCELLGLLEEEEK